jgi:hypothetical protein
MEYDGMADEEGAKSGERVNLDTGVLSISFYLVYTMCDRFDIVGTTCTTCFDMAWLDHEYADTDSCMVLHCFRFVFTDNLSDWDGFYFTHNAIIACA